MACCRHLIILQAVNMFVGESYRHAHYLHNFLYNAGYRIFCYDIVCLYWKWAEKVGKKIKRFSSLTKKMVAFLARFHAIAHVWHCYVRHLYQCWVSFQLFKFILNLIDIVGWSLAERCWSDRWRRTRAS